MPVLTAAAPGGAQGAAQRRRKQPLVLPLACPLSKPTPTPAFVENENSTPRALAKSPERGPLFPSSSRRAIASAQAASKDAMIEFSAVRAALRAEMLGTAAAAGRSVSPRPPPAVHFCVELTLVEGR